MQRHFHLLQNSLSSSWKQIITFQYVYFYYNTAFLQEFLLRQPQRNGLSHLVGISKTSYNCTVSKK